MKFGGDYMSQCISCIAQDNTSSSVARGCQKVARPSLYYFLKLFYCQKIGEYGG